MNLWRWVTGLSLAILLGACTAPQPNQQTIEPEANYWQPLGNSVGTGSNISLVTDGTSNTIMASVAFDGVANNVYVRHWDGSTWTQMGPALSAVGGFTNAASPALALDGNGNPVLAVSEDTGGIFTIYVRRWQNGSWVAVGSALNAETNDDNFNTDAIEPSLALDSLGNPVVAWSEVSGSDGIRRTYIWRWTGVVWQGLGTFIISGDTRNPSLALDSSDRPVIAWQDFSGGSNYDIYVYGFNGSTWVQYGSGPIDINAGSAAYDPSLTLDSNNNPVITWYEELGGNSLNVYVKRWNGTAWVQYGSGGPLDITPFNTAYAPSLSLDNGGNPTVAWSEFGASTYTLHIKQWTGSTWTLVGTNPLSNIANHAHYPSLSLVNGNLVVGWQEGTSTTPVISDSLYVKKYVTNSWQDMGNLLDVAGGQSALNSSIARKSNNTPVVAWDEDDSVSGTRNVYVKEWTGTAWSGLAGAVDRINGDAENPSIAMRSDNRPVVAWQENNNVYVRRWTGTLWSSIGSTALDTVLGNDAITPSLALQLAPSLDIPIVAYAENGDILVKKASGTLGSSIWAALGAALDTTIANEAYRPSLALKADNNPIVAWYEDIGTSFNIYAKEWNGTAWVPLGTTIDKTVSRDAKDIVLAIRTDNRPVVAWEEAGNVYVKRWTGTSWVAVGGVLQTLGTQALYPSLDLRTDNNPVVTWQEHNGVSFDVRVKRWTGSKWTSVTTNVVDKNASKNAERPAIVLKSDNNPIVSWDEDDGLSENVFVRQF